MWKEFTVQRNQKWLKILPKTLKFYNQKVQNYWSFTKRASEKHELII